MYEIFSNNDITLSLNILNDLYEKTNEISTKVTEEPIETEKIIENMQKIIDKLSMIICGFGTMNIDDLLFISFGSQYSQIKVPNPIIADKYEIIRKYVYPLGYKIIHWKDNKQTLSKNPLLCCNKIIEDIIQIENTNMFECFDVDTNVKLFYQKIYGVRVVIQNETLKKTIIVNGIIEDLNIDCLNNKYITARKDYLVSHARTLPTNDQQIMDKIINAITLKDILIFGDLDFHKKIYSVLAEISQIKTNKLDITIKKFLENDLCSQRNMLINLLLHNKEDEMQYICYLLYDLISVNSADNVDTKEQLMIYDSLPWKIKSYFKDIVKCTIKYTNDMVQKYDINKISLEQQIYLLKVDDAIKEKALVKLKEIKGKSDESGTKAKQYLEGLIKIPFGFYKEEPLLKKMKELNESFIKIMNNSENLMSTMDIVKKDKYTKIEMLKNITKIN
jgi:hypothetical protein